MIYIVLIVIGVILLQLWLARFPIAGLILPMMSIFGLLMSGMVLLAPSGEGLADSRNRVALLLFLLLAAATFLIYFLQRQKEYQEGYLNDEKAENKSKKRDSVQ